MRSSTALAVALIVSSLCFSPRPASATNIVLTGFTADMQSANDPRTGNQIVSLLINSSFFTPGGIAGGLAAISGQPPAETLWLADPFLAAPPEDAEPAVGFVVNPGGEVMGIEPSPFRIFLTLYPPDPITPADIIGELDFSGVTGSLGSLNLSGLVVREVDGLGVQTGVSHNVALFTL